jgi:hypothetical protein
MYLYRGKVYSEDQTWELMRLIEADIRMGGYATTIGEKYARRAIAIAHYEASRPYHPYNVGVWCGTLRRMRQKTAVVQTEPLREKMADISARERIIQTRIASGRARRRRSRVEIE